YPARGLDNNRAPDVHSAEWIERRTISVEPEALHNGFRYLVPTEVLVPSKVHTYRPCSVCTLQGCGNRAVARAVLDVPSAIAATRQPNAQVKARELIIVLVNFVFIVIVSFCLSFFIVLAFLASHRGRSHLAVHSFLRKILPGVVKTKILSGEPPKPTCEDNGKSAAIRESIVLPT